MKKRKVVKSQKSHKKHFRPSYSLAGGKKLIWGIEQDFILITGGSFVLVIFGLMILVR